MYARFAKPLLFRLDAERAHHLTMQGAALAGHIPGLTGLIAAQTRPHPVLSQTLWGRAYTSPLGLAAGLDKNAEAVPVFSSIGFGFVEVGTVTPRSQPGNPQPRLFRLPDDAALINRMGFNNGGSGRMAAHLKAVRHAPVWVNIGKNKDTPNGQAARDYVDGVRALARLADGFVVNVSSPNTPGLRSLQAADELGNLVGAVLDEVRRLRPELPVLVKLSPDMEAGDFAASVQAMADVGVSGLVISNTTLSREGLTHASRQEAGGLSGRPLEARSTALIAQAFKLTGGKLPIVGVGGVFTPLDAYAKILAGASLVEIYTSLVYEGPTLPSRINAGLVQLLKRDGFKHVSEAVGAGIRNF
jgi:dihydroorotate dehydrogenase